MKALIFAAAFLFSTISMAGLDLVVDNTAVNSTNGSWDNGDGTSTAIIAPWMTMHFVITNNTQTSVTLTSFGLIPGVAPVTMVPRIDGLPLAPGESYTYDGYIDQLPGDNLNYGIVEIMGAVAADTTEQTLVSALFSVTPAPQPAPAPTTPAPTNP